jgi:hypothetical protein
MNYAKQLSKPAIYVLSFLVIAHLGLQYKTPVAELINAVAPSWSAPLREVGSIQGLWIAVVGVHAAVAALAPILGYTLLATNVTAASRIAPAGPVVAQEIGWTRYLEQSLTLLVGSVVALVSAPSLLGLVAATAAMAFVLLRTVQVFKKGFDLLERPEQFDKCARSYLKTAIAHVEVKPDIAPNLKEALELANSSLAELPYHDRWSYPGSQYLYLGGVANATQVIAVKGRSIEGIVSEAEKLGLEVRRVQERIPEHIGRFRLRLLAVSRPNSLVVESEGVPSSEPEPEAVDIEAIRHLQRELEKYLVFGATPWTEEMTRLPMLAKRHVASVLYESVPAEQPHDFEYGLEVLSEVIDELCERHKDGEVLSLDVFDWVQDVPSFLANQIAKAPHSRGLYARHLANFLRGRLVGWLSIPAMENLAKSYVYRLVAMMKGFMPRDMDSAAYIALVIRETPLLVLAPTRRSVIVLCRELVVLFVAQDFADSSCSAQRKLVLKTIREMVRYTKAGMESDAFAETMIVVLAMSLFRAQSDTRFVVHVEEVLKELVAHQYDELPFESLLRRLSEADRVSNEWGLTWWELSDREEGEANWLSMETWLLRSTLVSLSQESWRLNHLSDDEIPGEGVLQLVLRECAEEAGWVSLLPGSYRMQVLGMRGAIEGLLGRRKQTVLAKVLAAPIDIEKVKKYVSEIAGDVRASFDRHNDWFKAAGAVVVDGEDERVLQSGSSRLVPKEWFVPDEVLDVSTHVVPPRVGRSMIEFELKKLVGALAANQAATAINAPADAQVWASARQCLEGESRKLLVLGVGVGEGEVSAELDKLRKLAGPEDGQRIAYRTVRRVEGFNRAIIVASVPDAFQIIRREPLIEQDSLYEERLPLIDGGVVSGISLIDELMVETWLQKIPEADREDSREQYGKSLLDRNVWKFSIAVRNASAYQIFVLEGEKVETSLA